MKKTKIAIIIASVILLFAVGVMAADKVADNIEAAYMAEHPEEYSDALGVDIFIEDKMLITDSEAVFELYDTKGKLIGTNTREITADTERIYLHFTMPTYKLGTDFVLKLVSGLTNVLYYEDRVWAGEETTLHTYVINNEDGTVFQGNNFIMHGCPLYEKGICIYYDGELLEFEDTPKIVNGVAMAPIMELGKAMKLKSEYHEDYNSVSSKIGPYEVLFNINDKYTTVFGEDTYISHGPTWVGSAIYVPVRDTLEMFGSSIEVLDFDDHLDIIASDATLIREHLNKTPVNKYGIYSRTPYLVWVSKSEYTVRVYTGSQYNWELAYEAPCGIGAPGTPTIEGQFEYKYRDSRWTYPSYYVGPALVFYGGYALHSTLLNYDGTEYDGTVRAKISHGCIRLHPWDINWIAARIPVGTKIYITG